MDPYVTVHRSGSPLLAEIARDVLEEAGLAVRVTESDGEHLVSVPTETRAQAEGLLAARGELAPEAPEPDGPARPRRLRPILAAGVTPVCPGGAHFYARRRVAGALILGGQAVALVALAFGGTRTATIAALTALGLFVFDVVGGQLAVHAENRGRRASGARQATLGAIVLAVLGVAATLLAPVVERLHLGRRGAHGGPGDAWRAGTARPEDLPFPLHLDLTR